MFARNTTQGLVMLGADGWFARPRRLRLAESSQNLADTAYQTPL
jgi:hypothetical protein